MVLLGDRDRRAENSTRKMVRGKDFDQSVNDVINLDTLAKVEEEVEEGEQPFSLFPDETTADQMYIWHNSPSTHGFLNAKKRTNVAGQVAGLNM